jgi:hypothetical protein
MFSEATSKQLEALLFDSLIHFAEGAPDITAFPATLDETLQDGARTGAAAPFHFALFPEVVRFKVLERSFSSNLGSTFEDIASTIGREHFGHAERQYVVEGRLRATAGGAIEQVLRDYETFVDGKRVRVPNADAESALITPLLGPGGEDCRETLDLFLRDESNGQEHYFHMKTVKPNKDQSNKAKRLMLRVRALRAAADARVFFGMAYNPYGEGNPYRWSFPRPYLDFEREVLIGGSFWDYIGGTGTFEQLMLVALLAGKRAHDQVVQKLGL